MMRGQRTTGWHVFGSFSASTFQGRPLRPAGRRKTEIIKFVSGVFYFSLRTASASDATRPDKKRRRTQRPGGAHAPLQEPLSRS